MPKKIKKEELPVSDIEALFNEDGIDNKELMSLLITFSKNFCQDNVLALTPLLQDEETADLVKERIFYFELISDILDSVDNLFIEADSVVAKCDKKKGKGKKSKEK